MTNAELIAEARAQLLQMLGASNQTEAVTALRVTLAQIKLQSSEFATQKGDKR
jgi:ethanolamine utilization microcompartment shell protein EutS